MTLATPTGRARTFAPDELIVSKTDLKGRITYANDVFLRVSGFELDELIGAWCAGRSLAEIQRLADDAGIGNSRLNAVGDLVEHPQLVERERWRTVGTPSGPVPALLPPAVAEDWTVRAGDVPALGQHTDAIRAEVLGHYSKES